MGGKRLVWHFGFEWNLRERGSHAYDVQSEVPLSKEPLRMDYLLLRRVVPDGEPVTDDACTLRGLWPLLTKVAVVELKSVGRPYRRGDLDRLWGYTHTYFADQCALPRKRGGAVLTPAEGGPDVEEASEVCAVLIVPGRTPSLDADVEGRGLRWESVGPGYLRVHGGLFTLYVVELEAVADAEHDEVLESFATGTFDSPDARRFWSDLIGSKEVAMSNQDLEGYDEVMRRLIQSASIEVRLEGIAPEQRLAGLPPEQRLAGLDRDHQALALPIEVLRALSEEYLLSLGPEVQAEIRRRLRENGH